MSIYFSHKTPYMVSTIIRTYFVKKPVRVQTVLSMKMPSSHHSSTTSMATATTKKIRHLLKKEVMFTLRGLLKLDLDIMEAFVIKEVEAVESQVARYPERQALGQCTCLGSD